MKHSIVILLCLTLCLLTSAQDFKYTIKDKALYDTIAGLDSVQWTAFNNRDVGVLNTLLADYLVLYDYELGAQNYSSVKASLKFCFDYFKDKGFKREVIPGSLEVYAVPGFGAIEVVRHQLVSKDASADMQLVQLWQQKEGKWKVVRIINTGPAHKQDNENRLAILMNAGLNQLLYAREYPKQEGMPEKKKLYNAILHMDDVMFTAFNKYDMPVLETVFSKDVEFYNDGGGVSGYATTMKNFKTMFAQQVNSGLRRELVKPSFQVYPVPGFGAIEVAEHRFIHTENGKEEVGLQKFFQVWRYKDGKWQAICVISLGH